jgi:hypothetical protein
LSVHRRQKKEGAGRNSVSTATTAKFDVWVKQLKLQPDCTLSHWAWSNVVSAIVESTIITSNAYALRPR